MKNSLKKRGKSGERGWERNEREWKKERDFSSLGSFPEWLQWYRLGLNETRSQAFMLTGTLCIISWWFPRSIIRGCLHYKWCLTTRPHHTSQLIISWFSCLSLVSFILTGFSQPLSRAVPEVGWPSSRSEPASWLTSTASQNSSWLTSRLLEIIIFL